MSNKLRKLKICKVALVDAGAGKGVKVALWKSRDGKPVRKGNEMDLQALLAAVAALDETGKAQVLAALGKAKDPTPEEKVEAEKAAAVAKARAEKDAEIVDLKKRLDAVDAERAKDKLTERVSKSLRGVVGKTEEIVADLLAITDEKIRESVIKRLEETGAARVEALTKSGALKEIGSSLDGGGGSSADEAFAAEVRRVQETEKLKRHEAIIAVQKRRPDLWAKRTAERKGA